MSVLSGAQFPLEDISAMRSGDFHGMTMGQTYDELTASQRLRPPQRTKEVYHPSSGNYMAKQRRLKQELSEQGQQTPLRTQMNISGSLKRSIVENGHHRYWAARDLGWSHLAVGN